MINKEYKANALHDAYVDLKSAASALSPIASDDTVKPLLNEIIALQHKLQQAYEKAYAEADNL